MDERRAPLSRYRCDLRHVVDSRASAYGYTLTVWFTGMVLSHAVGLPSPPLAFSFFLGAVLGFAAVGVVAFEGVTAEFGVLPSYLLDRAKELSVLGEEVLEALTDETAGAILRKSARLPEREKEIVLGIVRQFGSQIDDA